MLFSGIEIPNQINVLNRDLVILESVAYEFSENPKTYIAASLGLVATWGEMIKYGGFSPDFSHGIADIKEGCVALFNIPEYCKNNEARLIERERAAEELGLEYDKEITKFDIDINSIADLARIACGFYDVTFDSIISAAIDKRKKILNYQDKGFLYVFSSDNENWIEMELTTYPVNN